MKLVLALLSLSLLSGCYAVLPEPEPKSDAGPDLAMIADVPGNGLVIMRLRDPGSELQVLSYKGFDGYEHSLPQQLQWSPDGKRLLFSNYWHQAGELTLVNADGTGLQELTHTPEHEYDARWSPSGREIAYTSGRGAQGSQLMVMELETGKTRKLAQRAWSPIWSPDGQQLAFLSDHDGSQTLYLIGADGQGLRRLTHSQASDGDPEWSPDGRKLVYNACDSSEASENRCALNVLDIESGQRTTLTGDAGMSYNGRWSPDGTQIVFVSEHEEHHVIELIQADGSGRRRLYDAAGNSFGPDWSPSGDRIVFHHQTAGPDVTHFDILIINPDGSQLQRLELKDGNGEPLTAYWPNWAPR